MPETKKYAIRCSTEEQAREVDMYFLNRFGTNTKCLTIGTNEVPCIVEIDFITKEVRNWICGKPDCPIITYEEAVGLGLLGEKGMSWDGAREFIENMGTKDNSKEEVKEERDIEELNLNK